MALAHPIKGECHTCPGGLCQGSPLQDFICAVETLFHHRLLLGSEPRRCGRFAHETIIPAGESKNRPSLQIGGPSSDNPPRRNAGVIWVLDITDFPKKKATLVYFKWVYGYGTYDNFLTAYEYAYRKYRPLDALIDSTGTQKLWNEQVLLDRGIMATGMNFSGDKKGMLVAAMRLVERQLIRWPYIQGIRSQLLTYKLAEDNKLPQDIVATLMMAAQFLKVYQWEEYVEENTPEQPVVAAPAREARQVVLTPRTAGIYLPR